MTSKEMNNLRDEVKDLLNQIMIKTKDVKRSDSDNLCEAFLVNLHEKVEDILKQDNH